MLGYYQQNHSLYNVIGVEKAASILNLAPGTVKNMCADGKIPAKKVGKTWIIDESYFTNPS
uniref:DNA-binding protein n=1 Tax=Aeromonas sp. Ne-1 TaxID=1675689 RepID=A0A0H4J959_9GAMM|nr:DNA-binding protein [Aeromonas sp. Ne-1]